MRATQWFVTGGAKPGEWDIAMMGISSEREQVVDFTTPYMIVEFSYLVPSGSSISTLADIVFSRIASSALPNAELTCRRSAAGAKAVRFSAGLESII